MSRPTARQQQVLDFIQSHIDESGYPPTLREICAHIGVSGTLSAIRHLDALEKKGYLNRDSSSRGISLTNRPPRPVMVPIVGSIRAGCPEEAVEDAIGHCATDPDWTRGADCFYLRVTGDSMIEAGIREGDLALVRSQSTAENGEIVVALIDGEATLKHFYLEDGQIRLQPANAALQPIIVQGTLMSGVTIAGKLLKIIRDYE
jgi:repressor LexA